MSQPKPKKTNGPHIVDLVIKDLKDRKRLGLKKYGVPLQAHNGRDCFQDAIEEVMDLLCYMKQFQVENDKQKRSKTNPRR